MTFIVLLDNARDLLGCVIIVLEYAISHKPSRLAVLRYGLYYNYCAFTLIFSGLAVFSLLIWSSFECSCSTGVWGWCTKKSLLLSGMPVADIYVSSSCIIMRLVWLGLGVGAMVPCDAETLTGLPYG
jgi:hypothetical protein